eukprot:3813918-Amphidinium_carterae.1
MQLLETTLNAMHVGELRAMSSSAKLGARRTVASLSPPSTHRVPQHARQATHGFNYQAECASPIVICLWAKMRADYIRSLFVASTTSQLAGGRPRQQVQVANAYGAKPAGLHSDLSKAYEAIPHSIALHLLKQLGVASPMANVILSMYTSNNLIAYGKVVRVVLAPIRGIPADCFLAVWLMGWTTWLLSGEQTWRRFPNQTGMV